MIGSEIREHLIMWEFGLTELIQIIAAFLTLSAVIYFQLDCGLSADGVVGAQTWQAIRTFSAEKVSRGARVNRSGQMIADFAMARCVAVKSVSAISFNCLSTSASDGDTLKFAA